MTGQRRPPPPRPPLQLRIDLDPSPLAASVQLRKSGVEHRLAADCSDLHERTSQSTADDWLRLSGPLCWVALHPHWAGVGISAEEGRGVWRSGCGHGTAPPNQPFFLFSPWSAPSCRRSGSGESDGHCYTVVEAAAVSLAAGPPQEIGRLGERRCSRSDTGRWIVDDMLRRDRRPRGLATRGSRTRTGPTKQTPVCRGLESREKSHIRRSARSAVSEPLAHGSVLPPESLSHVTVKRLCVAGCSLSYLAGCPIRYPHLSSSRSERSHVAGHERAVV